MGRSHMFWVQWGFPKTLHPRMKMLNNIGPPPDFKDKLNK